MRTCDISSTGSQLDTVICRGMMVVVVAVHLVTGTRLTLGLGLVYTVSYSALGKGAQGDNPPKPNYQMLSSSYERIPDDQHPVEEAPYGGQSSRYTDDPAAADVQHERPPIYYGEGPFDPPSSEEESIGDKEEDEPQPSGEDEFGDAELQLSAKERKVCVLFCARTTRQRGVLSCVLTCHFQAETFLTSCAGDLTRCARRISGTNRNNCWKRIFRNCDSNPWIAETDYGSHIRRDILS